MDKYDYKSFKATCLYNEGTPYQDKSAYEEFNKEIREKTGAKDFLSLDANPTQYVNFYEKGNSDTRFFNQNLHMLYVFILVSPENKTSFSLNNCILSRIYKLESYPDPFVAIQNYSFFYYYMIKLADSFFWTYSRERYFIYYSPETKTCMYECSVGCCYMDYPTFAFSLNKDYELSSPDIPKNYSKSFIFLSNDILITGNLENDKEQTDFFYVKDIPDLVINCQTYESPYSFWRNFYKHFGNFNIHEFKKIIKRNAIEIHPFDDSSFDKVNKNKTLKRFIYRSMRYPTGFLRYIAYSFFSKGDDIDESKIIEYPSKIQKKPISTLLTIELRIALNVECEMEDWANAPYENPYALGDLWNLKLGTDMILYHPVLKEAALVDGWEKKIYVFRLD